MTAGGVDDVSDIIRECDRRLRTEPTRTRGLYMRFLIQVVVPTTPGRAPRVVERYVVRLGDGTGYVRLVDGPEGTYDATLSMQAGTLRGLVDGRVDALEAIRTSRLQVAGSLSKAAKMARALQ